MGLEPPLHDPLLLQKSVELHDLTPRADYRYKLLPKLRSRF